MFHAANTVKGDQEPVPAIIQAVFPGGLCRLAVFGEHGLLYEQNVSQGAGPSQWSFPERVGN
jgi:hypothetical protein